MQTPHLQLLQGQKTRLRAYAKSDIDPAIAFLNDLEVRSLMWPGIMFPLRREDEEKWYDSFHAMSDGEYHFAIERNDSGDYIGGCGIAEVNHKTRIGTIGIFIGKPHQNLGFGTEAMGLLVDFCFMEMNMHKLKLHVYAFNERAMHCYRKLGFTTEAVLRQECYRNGMYHDEHIMGLLRSEWDLAQKRDPNLISI